MQKKTDVLVIGGGPAGIISAVTARKYYPDKKIVLMKSVAEGVIPCGIPYMFASLNCPDDNKLGNQALEKNGIDVVIDEAVAIRRDRTVVETKSGGEFRYEKLILAAGSSPILPPVPGIDLQGVYPVNKDMVYLTKVIEEVKQAKTVLVLGGGFIGVEFADEISKMGGKKVFLVEMLPHILANSFDPEFSQLAQDKLSASGVDVLTGIRVEKLSGAARVEKAHLSDGRIIAIDAVVLGIGALPNTQLAVDAGLDLGKGRGIWVDEYMRTSDPDIFAVGDCAGKRDFFTRRNAPVLLASTATAEARVAGANLYALKVVRENKGTIAIYSTFINGLVLGSAGLTENSARKEKFEIVTGKVQGMDKHPGSLPGTQKITMKLIFSRQSGILMGGQIAGGISVGELINVIGLGIQQRVSLTELETLQMATHPFLTSAPTMYPIVLAAQDASGKM